MKGISLLFFLLSCLALPAQVLIDQARKEPELIVRSNLDTLEADYLTDQGVFRGYIVRRTYRVTYAAIAGHNGLEFDQVVEVWNSEKKAVKNVLGVTELSFAVQGTPWIKYQPPYIPTHRN